MATITQALEQRVDYAAEFRVFHASGAMLWLANLGRAEYDDHGGPRHLVGIFQDITAQKQAEAALIQAKENWEQTFDTIPDFIAILDAEHRIVQVNQAMADGLKASPGQCVGLQMPPGGSRPRSSSRVLSPLPCPSRRQNSRVRKCTRRTWGGIFWSPAPP